VIAPPAVRLTAPVPVFTAATWWGAATGAIVALSVAYVAYRRGRRRAQ